MLLRWLLALIVCGLLIWSISLDFSSPQAPTVAVNENKIDYFIEGLNLRSLDTNGKLDYSLSATTMLHYENADNIELTAPQITMVDEQTERWHLVSETGTGDIDGDVIDLTGNVILTDIANDLTPTQLSTDVANINRIAQTITSEEYTEITMGKNTLTATGMLISLETGLVNLQSQVVGNFISEDPNE